MSIIADHRDDAAKPKRKGPAPRENSHHMRVLAMLTERGCRLLPAELVAATGLRPEQVKFALGHLAKLGLAHAVPSHGWQAGAKVPTAAERRTAEAAEQIAPILAKADESLTAGAIGAMIGITPDAASTALRLLSRQGRARRVMGTATNRALWTNAKVVSIRNWSRVGHMLEEEGTTDHHCLRYSKCLDAAAHENFAVARCPRECTLRRHGPPDAELIALVSARRQP